MRVVCVLVGCVSRLGVCRPKEVTRVHYVDMRYVRENGSTIMFRCYVKTGNATVKAYDTVHRVSLTGKEAVQYLSLIHI